MSIRIGMSQHTFNKIKRQLINQDEVICLSKQAHIQVTLVALELLKTNKDIKAKIIKGYK